jgi:hypothetical protein
VKNTKYRAERVFSSLYGAVKKLIPHGNHFIVRGYFPMYGNTMEIGYRLSIGYTTLNVKLWLYDWFSVIEFPRGEEFQWPILPGLPYLKAPSKALIVLEEDGDEWPAYIDIDRAYIAALKYITTGRYLAHQERTVKRCKDADFRYDLLDKNPPYAMIDTFSWRVEDVPSNIKDLAFKPLLVG